jgi:hypothetical protein
MRIRSGLAALVFLSPAYALAAPNLSATDTAAAFKAAGFKQTGGEWIRCDDTVTASRMAGFIETEDLNGDGQPEAWVRESSTYCYGNTAEAFVLLTKKNGAWTVLLDEVGIASPRTTKTNGWVDIEVGGPGMGPMPVYRFNGTKYVPRR